MDQLRVAVKCRLRSIKPVGAMLSGGLDSSTIVGLISKEFRGELREPLRTFSLIREDRENCPDWLGIQAILQADPWLQPAILTSAKANEVWQSLLASIAQTDEPFAFSHGFTYGLTYEAAHSAGCAVVLDGMAGDVLFYSLSRTAAEFVRRHRFGQFSALLTAYRNHGFDGGQKEILRTALGRLAPNVVRAWVRRRRDERQMGNGDMEVLRHDVARQYLASKRSAGYLAGYRLQSASDQMAHASNFTNGLISFGHETYGSLAFASGVEPRSPFSDRRMIEFAIQMPLTAKIAIPWYKHLLRLGTAGMLPDAVRWRSNIGGHPGWTFYQQLIQSIGLRTPEIWHGGVSSKALERWINSEVIQRQQLRHAKDGGYDFKYQAFRLLVLQQWKECHQWLV